MTGTGESTGTIYHAVGDTMGNPQRTHSPDRRCHLQLRAKLSASGTQPYATGRGEEVVELRGAHGALPQLGDHPALLQDDVEERLPRLLSQHLPGRVDVGEHLEVLGRAGIKTAPRACVCIIP